VLVLANRVSASWSAWRGQGQQVTLCGYERGNLRLRLLALRPDWLLIEDHSMGAYLDAAVSEARETSAHLRIAVVVASGDLRDPGRWIRSGISCFLVGSAGEVRVLEAIKFCTLNNVIIVEAGLQRDVVKVLARVASPEVLTNREVEILGLAGHGLRSAEMATTLGVSEHTIEFHMRTITGKLGVRGRAQAVSRGIFLGYIASDEG
jgi:DNA-binding NarL/FixJ family response regulator